MKQPPQPPHTHISLIAKFKFFFQIALKWLHTKIKARKTESQPCDLIGSWRHHVSDIRVTGDCL